MSTDIDIVLSRLRQQLESHTIQLSVVEALIQVPSQPSSISSLSQPSSVAESTQYSTPSVVDVITARRSAGKRHFIVIDDDVEDVDVDVLREYLRQRQTDDDEVKSAPKNVDEEGDDDDEEGDDDEDAADESPQSPTRRTSPDTASPYFGNDVRTKKRRTSKKHTQKTSASVAEDNDEAAASDTETGADTDMPVEEKKVESDNQESAVDAAAPVAVADDDNESKITELTAILCSAKVYQAERNASDISDIMNFDTLFTTITNSFDGTEDELIKYDGQINHYILKYSTRKMLAYYLRSILIVKMDTLNLRMPVKKKIRIKDVLRIKSDTDMAAYRSFHKLVEQLIIDCYSGDRTRLEEHYIICCRD